MVLALRTTPLVFFGELYPMMLSEFINSISAIDLGEPDGKKASLFSGERLAMDGQAGRCPMEGFLV